jgi:hypothetical protein
MLEQDLHALHAFTAVAVIGHARNTARLYLTETTASISPFFCVSCLHRAVSLYSAPQLGIAKLAPPALVSTNLSSLHVV